MYAFLVKDLTVVTMAVGFDPYLGFYHRPRFGRPALALDLAEEFRPLVGDSVILTLINNGEVGAADFVVRAGGVGLTVSGRRAVIAAYERRLDVEVRHPVFLGRSPSLNRKAGPHCGLCAWTSTAGIPVPKNAAPSGSPWHPAP